MNTFRSSIITAATVAALAITSGCAVTRGQSTVGQYVDDTAITASIKARMVEDSTVDASAINIDTLDGTVILSGFAKSQAEKDQAEVLARKSAGVKEVKNSIVVKS